MWRLKYRHDRRENRLALGIYPDTTLKLAREQRDDVRRLLAAGIDSSTRRQAERLAIANTFEAVARGWLGLQERKLAAATFAKAKWTIETLVFSVIGSRPMAKLTPPDILKMLRIIEKRGTYETAHRTRQRCAQVFRYAVQTDRAERDVTADLHGGLGPIVTAHHASITAPALVGQALRDIDAYHGYVVSQKRLRREQFWMTRLWSGD